MDVLIEFKRPSSTPCEESITWQPREAPIDHFARLMDALTPEIVGERYEHLVGLFDRERGVFGDEDITAGYGYIVYAADEIDPQDVIIVHDYDSDVRLVMSARSLLECIEALHRSYWFRTPQYVQAHIVSVDLDELPDVRDSLLWAQR